MGPDAAEVEHAPARRGGAPGPDPFAPYLPRLVAEWIVDTPDERWREVDGTIVFVDMSGFTALSERLARHGKIGAEELTDAIGNCFVSLLAIAYDDGGSLLKFGGDALLLLFRGHDHPARACRAAVGMRRTLRTIAPQDGSGRRITLRMSVGIHSGTFQFLLVGESHRELIVTGPAATATVEMEGTAEAGQIVVSEATAAALRPGLLGPAKGPGRLLARAPGAAASIHATTAPVASDPALQLCVPVAIREHLRAGVLQPEHRRVTVTFIHFDGTDALVAEAGVAEVARRLDGLVRHVQAAVDAQRLTFLGTDIDRDGGKIILVGGAPDATGDDEHRMLLAVRDVVDTDHGVPLRVGVNRGPVFAGDIGPPYRRTFTVMGDAVNLAARLMAKARPGQILATGEVLARARARIETDKLEPFLVKGKRQPVTAFALGAVSTVKRAAATDDLALLGRDEELDRLRAAVRGVSAGDGALVELVGEAGVGKTRLVHALRGEAAGMTQLGASCEPYEATTPDYLFWQLLRRALDLPDGSDADAAAGLRQAVVTADPELEQWLPLVADVVGVAVPETPSTMQLDEQFRRPWLAEVIGRLLAATIPGPVLVVVEDAQWIDDASAELLRRLTADLSGRPWLWCVTRRDEGEPFAEGDHVTRLRLLPLDERAATELLELATADAPLPRHQVAALAGRAEGNPLFLRELAAVARDASNVDELPDSVEALIASRIDQLEPVARNLLRDASVLGRAFRIELLRAVVDDPPVPDSPVWDELAEYLQVEADGSVHFAHALVRDCAYQGLAFRRRRELHARAGDALLASIGGDAEDDLELLSFHFFAAQRYRQSLEYSQRAAERARAVYANVEASEFLERAIASARRLPDIGSALIAGLHEELGDTRNLTGDYAAADAAYRAARRGADADPVAQARLILKLSQVQGWLDRYPNALRWITKGLRTLDGADDDEAAPLRAQLLAWYARFCQEEGHHHRAIRWCRRAVAEAEAAGERDALANALKVLDWANMDLGQLGDPVNWTRALSLFEELDDLAGQASLLNLLGGLAYFRGDWTEALVMYRRAQDRARRTGNAVMDAFYVNNIAEVFLDQGRLDEAEELFVAASRVWRAAGYRSGAASIKGNLARVAVGKGRFEEACRLLGEATAEALHVGGNVEALEATARLAECHLLAGDPRLALEVADGALASARALGGVAAQSPLLHRVRGAALARMGDVAEAGAALEQSVRAARQRDADYEVALTYRVLAGLGLAVEDLGPDEIAARSAAMFDRLGVVWTADLLGGGVTSPPPG